MRISELPAAPLELQLHEVPKNACEENVYRDKDELAGQTVNPGIDETDVGGDRCISVGFAGVRRATTGHVRCRIREHVVVRVRELDGQ